MNPKKKLVSKVMRAKPKKVTTNAAGLRAGKSVDIIKSVQPEEALRESEQKQRMLYETMAQGVIYLNGAGRIISANPAAERILGKTIDQLAGHRFVNRNWKLYREDGTPLPEKEHPVAVAMRTGKPVDHMTMGLLKPKGKSMVWLSVTAIPLFNQVGKKPFQVYSTFEDITAHKRVEEALFNSEARYRTVLQQSLEAIYLYDLDHQRVLEANSAFLKLLGYSDEEASKLTIYDIVANDRASIDAYLKHIQSSGGIPLGERIWRRKDGKTVQVEVTANKIKQGSRNIAFFVARDISERKQAEEALRVSEEKFRGLFENSRDALMVIESPSWKFTSGNPACVKLFGLKNEEELYSYGPWELSPARQPDGRRSKEKAKEMIETAVREGFNFFEWTHRRIGGEEFPADVLLIRIKHGEKDVLQATVRDITGRKRVDDALRESELRFRTLIEQAPVAISISRDGIGLYTNQKFRQTLGLPRIEDSMGRPVSEYFASQYREESKERSRLRSRGLPVSNEFETIGLRADGTQFPVQVVVAEIELSDGKANIGFITDITERKRDEEAVRESEEKFRTLADQSPNMIFINKKGRVVYANAKCEEVMGYTREELTAPDFNFLRLVSPDSKPIIRKLLHEHQKGVEIQPYEYGLITKEGRKIDAINASKVIRYGGEDAILGVVTDITERKQAEEALRRSEAHYQTLYAAAKRIEQERVLLDRVSNAIASELDLPTTLRMVVEAIAETFGYTLVSLYLLFDETLVLQHQIGYQRTLFTIPITKGITGRVARTGKPVLLENVHTDPTFLDAKEDIISEICVPLINEGKVIGVLNVESTRGVQLTEADLNFMTGLSDHISIAIERARLYTQVRESEERYRKFIEHAAESIYIYDTDTHLLEEANPAFLQLLGYTLDEARKLTLYDFDDGEKVEIDQKVADILELGSAVLGERHWRRKDGNLVDVFATVSTVKQEGHNYLFVLAQDITERKRTDQALRESEERISKIIQSEPECVKLLDSKGILLDMNPAGLAMIDADSLEQVKGKSIYNLVTPEYRAAFKAFNKRIFAGESGTLEFEILGLKGTRRQMETHAVPLRNAQNKITSHLGVARDVSERKQAQTLQEAVYRIAAATETTRSPDELYRQIHQIILSVMPAENFYITLFDEAQNLLRFPYFKDAADEPFIGEVHPERGLTAYVLRTGKSLLCTQAVHDELERQGEVKLLGAPSAIWLGVPLFVENKTIGAMVVQHYTDPTAYGEREQHMLEFVSTQVAIAINRKKTEEKILQLNAELEQHVKERTRQLEQAQEQLVRQEKLAVLGQLAGGVGHELRNPLTVIKSAIYFLKLVQPEANEKVRQYHEMIEQETRTAEKIISDLLDFARVKTAEQEPVSIPELVQRVLARYPVTKGITTVITLPASLPKVFADLRQMEQVLGNLTVNACQAMTNGGRLTISGRVRKEMVAIAVKDTGTGITAENMNKIFEPLFTTKTKGIGLGLAVSKKLAEANHGRIEVQSKPGIGSTFTLYLPVNG